MKYLRIKMSTCLLKRNNVVVDLGGMISCGFWENLAKSYVGAPLVSWHPHPPPPGKSWICHCNGALMDKKEQANFVMCVKYSLKIGFVAVDLMEPSSKKKQVTLHGILFDTKHNIYQTFFLLIVDFSCEIKWSL